MLWQCQHRHPPIAQIALQVCRLLTTGPPLASPPLLPLQGLHTASLKFAFESRSQRGKPFRESKDVNITATPAVGKEGQEGPVVLAA
jgi:hypothetical protein